MRKHEEIDSNLGTRNENEGGNKILDLLCLYALFRRLYPSEESRDFWKKMWTLQKKVPVISAHSFVCVYTANFLNLVTPLIKKTKSIDPKVTLYNNLGLSSLPEILHRQTSRTHFCRVCFFLRPVLRLAESHVKRRNFKSLSPLGQKVVEV